MLCEQRGIVARAGHNKLSHLRRLDDRLAAHLDGLSSAGDAGWSHCESLLAQAGAGELFASTVLAIEARNASALHRLLALAEALPEVRIGLHFSFAWVSAQFLKGTVSGLLASDSPFHRQVGIIGCGMHQVDPGPALDAALIDEEPELRASALCVAGAVGRSDLLASCIQAIGDRNDACRFEAARSSILLGDHGPAVSALQEFATQTGPHQADALRLLLKRVDAAQANAILRSIAAQSQHIRPLLNGVGVAGDSSYIAWLLKQMEDPALARCAGEAFTMITGLDLAQFDYDRKPPEDYDPIPNDDPDDDNATMEEDDGLPWPDPARLQAWWRDNQARFNPGVRYFMGQPVTLEHCKQVLRGAYQRQRAAAAEYLCLLQPGRKLFPTSAPAWRQERWLSGMN